MAKGRFISTSLANSIDFADLATNDSRLLFLLVIPHLDRDGRIHGDPRRLRSIVAPLLDFSAATVAAAEVEWVERGLACAYFDDRAQAVLLFPRFRDHQKGLRYSRETASSFSDPPVDCRMLPPFLRIGSGGCAVSPDGVRTKGLPDRSGSGPPEVKLSEVKLSEEEGARAKPRAPAAAALPPAVTPKTGADPVAAPAQPVRPPDAVPTPTSGDPQVIELAKAITGHSVFAELDGIVIAEAHIHWCQTGGKRLDWLVRAVGECARRAASAQAAREPWDRGQAADKLSRYLDRASAPRVAPGERPTGRAQSTPAARDAGTAPPMSFPRKNK